MNKDMKKKYDLIAKISGVVIGLVLVLGISYAVFRTTTVADKDNVVSAGKLDVRVENEKDEITIPNALPKTEAQGKSSTPYTFDIVNEGTIDAMYDLYIELSDDTTLKDNDIRYYLTKTVDGKETPIDDKTSHYLSDAIDETKKEKKLYRIDINDSLKVGKSVSYKLYLWIDYDATADEATNKVFKGVIRVDASQLVERNETLLRKVDVSENSDGSAYAYVYDDGTLKIIGTGNIASGIDDMDIYASNPTKVLKAYKKVLTSMGYDVSNITTMDEFNTFKEEQSTSDSSFDNNFNLQLELTSYKETLKEMGYTDTESIVDEETLTTYAQNNGIMDSEGNLTEKGEEFLTKAEKKYNSTYAETVSITNVEIEKGITNIPEGIYTGNSNITSVTIPSTVTSIDAKAFYNCTNLTTVTIPSSVTTIGDLAFYNCTSLTSIEIPDSITNVGMSVFYNCTSLTSVKISSNLTSISLGMFYNCTSLTSVIVPSSVTNIGISAFYGCTKLTEIIIPATVTNISDLAFYECTGLTSITIPSSVTSIGPNAFYDCTALTKTNYTGTIDEWVDIDFSGCYANPVYYSKNLYINDELVENVTIDKNIKQYALYNLQSLKSVTLTDNVTSVSSTAFSGCSGITKLVVDGTKNYGHLGISTITDLTITGTGNMYDYSSNSAAPWYSSRDKIKNVEISDTITSIGSNAFSGCTGITEITIPSSVTSIGSAAFENCTGLTSLEIPSSVTSIGSWAFYGCTGLTEITIPSSVITIGVSAFRNCKAITEITIPNSVTSIGQYAFYYWTTSQTINIDNTEEYATSSFSKYWKTNCNATINYLRT